MRQTLLGKHRYFFSFIAYETEQLNHMNMFFFKL